MVERLTKAMAEARHQQYWVTLSGEAALNNANMEFHEVCKTRGLERERLNEKQITLIRAVVPPELHASLPEWDFEEHPRPRPWDREYQRTYIRRLEEAIKRQLQEPNLSEAYRKRLMDELRTIRQ